MFTTAERVLIRRYLGAPSVLRYRDTRLEVELDRIGSDDPAMVAEIRSILADLATVETNLSTAMTTAGLKRADEVEWYAGSTANAGNAAIEGHKARGRMFCSRLSAALGVPIVHDAFGTKGYTGDWFFTPSMQNSNGGIIPMG